MEEKLKRTYMINVVRGLSPVKYLVRQRFALYGDKEGLDSNLVQFLKLCNLDNYITRTSI